MKIQYITASSRIIHRTGKYWREEKEYLQQWPADCLPRAALEI
jgi:hypothetical protein